MQVRACGRDEIVLCGKAQKPFRVRFVEGGIITLTTIYIKKRKSTDFLSVLFKSPTSTSILWGPRDVSFGILKIKDALKTARI